VASLVEEKRQLERDLAEARRLVARSAGAATPTAKRIGELSFDGRVVNEVPARELKSLADELKSQIGSGIVAVVSRAGGKASIVVAVSADLVRRFDAVALVRIAAGVLGGSGGGGRADMAQAGGPEGARAQAALAALEEAIAERLRVEA
jgi:alanyl-tRNA synthetase